MKQMTLRSLCNFAGNSSLKNVVHLDKIECFNTERTGFNAAINVFIK